MKPLRALLAALALTFFSAPGFAKKISMEDMLKEIDKTSDEKLARSEIPGQFPGFAWAYELSAVELTARGQASMKAGQPALAKARFTNALRMLEVVRVCGVRETEKPPRAVMINCPLPSVQEWPVYAKTGNPDIDSKMPVQRTGPKPDADKISSWHTTGNGGGPSRGYDAFVDSLHEALDGVKAAEAELNKKSKKADKPINK